MTAVELQAIVPEAFNPLPARALLLVDRDERAGALLGRYLEARGWRVSRISDPRRVIRQQAARGVEAPIVVLQFDEADTDCFELLGALAARAIAARVIVCARGWIEGLVSSGSSA